MRRSEAFMPSLDGVDAESLRAALLPFGLTLIYLPDQAQSDEELEDSDGAYVIQKD